MLQQGFPDLNFYHKCIMSGSLSSTSKLPVFPSEACSFSADSAICILPLCFAVFFPGKVSQQFRHILIICKQLFILMILDLTYLAKILLFLKQLRNGIQVHGCSIRLYHTGKRQCISPMLSNPCLHEPWNIFLIDRPVSKSPLSKLSILMVTSVPDNENIFVLYPNLG